MVSLKGVKPSKSSEYGIQRDHTRPVDAGQAGLNKKRLAMLEALRKSRNGFTGNARGKAVYYLSYFLWRGTQTTDDEIIARAIELGAGCIPPLPKETCERNFRDSLRIKKGPLDATLIKDLEMTPVEVAELFPPKPVRKPQETEKRRKLVEAFLNRRHAKFPTLDNIVAWLELKGITAGREIVRKDLLALGIENPRSRKGKPSN